MASLGYGIAALDIKIRYPSSLIASFIVVVLTASTGSPNSSVSMMASASGVLSRESISLSSSDALINGSSPMMTTYMSAETFRATSATLSVPVGCLSDVNITSIPIFTHSSTIIWLSVATITLLKASTFFAS